LTQEVKRFSIGSFCVQSLIDWAAKKGLLGERAVHFGNMTRFSMIYYLGQTTNQLTCSDIGFNCNEILKKIKERA